MTWIAVLLASAVLIATSLRVQMMLDDGGARDRPVLSFPDAM